MFIFSTAIYRDLTQFSQIYRDSWYGRSGMAIKEPKEQKGQAAHQRKQKVTAEPAEETHETWEVQLSGNSGETGVATVN
jgi:hypothetical protein